MKNSNANFKLKAFLIPITIMLILGVVLFLPAGSFRYWEGWVFWIINLISIFFITFYFMKKDPELLSRRTEFKEKEKTRKVPAIFNLYLLGYIIPGLDFRYHWSTVPTALIIAANGICFLGFILIILVFMKNTYASTIIQVEKEQKVITTGPYTIVRHPMYMGMLLMLLFTPLALGSYWAIIPFLLSIPMNIIRIKGEEEILTKEVQGYKDYCIKTKYRLIPFIW
ncbi:MAG: methyltransferase family protein [Deltaproteobacteria bacterium]